MPAALHIRPLGDTDSAQAITLLLHDAFAELSVQGFNFTAATQTEAVTRDRIAQGECLLATIDEVLVGTLIYHRPGSPKAYPGHDRPGMAIISQFGVATSCQGTGVGRRLLRAAEDLARLHGAAELALDTAEGAAALVDWYVRDGYAAVGHVLWPGKSYRSVILRKKMR